MKVKKLMSLLLSFALILSVFPVAAVAEDILTITVSGGEVTAGESIVVPVTMANNPGITNCNLQVNYNKDAFTLDKISLYPSTEDEENMENGGLFTTGTFDGYENTGKIGWFNANAIKAKSKVLFYLYFTAKGTANGSYEVSIGADESKPAFKNVDDVISVTFVPGTITVKGSTDERTVKFMNGETEVSTETVANGGTLSSIPEAPTASGGQSFLGWYALSGSDYVLDNVEETITGTEASTQTAITANTTYQAIWASSTMLAAGFAPKDGKTEITGISQGTQLQDLANNCSGGRVKLLDNVDLGASVLQVAAGATLDLDLNGKTLSGSGAAVDYTPYGVLTNNGTMSIYSSAETRGTICLNDAGTFDIWCGALTNNGMITRMKNVDVKVSGPAEFGEGCYSYAYTSSGNYNAPSSVGVQTIDDCSFYAPYNSAFTQSYGTLGTITNSTFIGGYWDQDYDETFSAMVLTNQTVVTEMKNCLIEYNNVIENSSAEAMYIGFDVTIHSMDECTISGPNGITITGYTTKNKSTIENLNATITANNGYALTVKNASADIDIIGGTYKGTNDHVFDTSAGTAAITYPTGKTLLKNQDGSWTVQDGYNVYFRNWDETLLQQISCAANGTAAYTGETPARSADENYVYTFSGWNTMKDGTGTTYTGNEVSNVTSDLTLYAQYSTVSARVVTLQYGSGGTGSDGKWLRQGGYPSLKAAIDALNSNNGKYNNVVITLNEDATETETLTIQKTVTIDLNGHTLTIDNDENGIAVENGAALTVKDSSANGSGVFKHTATGVEKSAILASGSGTVVNVESGTIQAAKGNALTVDGAAFHVSGGTISGGQNGICVKTQSSSPDCTISGGKILCSGNGYALYMDQSVAPYIKLSGGLFKNTTSDNGTYLIRYADKCSYTDGKSLSTSPNTEGFYEVRVVGTYTFVLKAGKEHYNAGETVTVTVSAYGSGSINSFGFTPSYDAQKLMFVDVKPADTNGNFTVNQETGKSGYTVNGKSGITLGTASTDATELVTITFTAKENINDTATITLNNLEMTGVGTQGGDKAVVENTLSVNLHDIRVTLTAEHGTINGKASETLYAKYNNTGLYSDAARTTEATVDVSANEGYRLNDKQNEDLWLCGETGYADFNAIEDLTFTESKTFALQTTKVWTISFNTDGVTGGRLSGTDAITVDNGTKLSAAGLPTATPDTGYTFTGWKAGNAMVDVDNTVTADITLTPVFTAQSYDFTATENKSTVTVTNGLTADGKATYGQGITFTVTPNSGYIVESVGYRIGDQATALTTLSPDQNEAYTIEGSKITGKVTVEVVTKAFYVVTFTVDTEQTYTLGDGNTTFYTKEGTAGLYTDTTFTTKATAPVLTVTDGYRLADESKSESLWYAGETSYTTASLFGDSATAAFTSAATIYAKTIKQWKVTFAAGEHGTLTGNTELIVDTGTTLASVAKPTVTPNAGYAFDKWSAENSTVIDNDLTVTAQYKDGTYHISLPDSAIVSVSDKSGISDANVVTHGTGVSFKLTVNHGYLVSSVSYKIGEGTATTVNKNTDGTYTISIAGADIIGNVTITVESQQTVDVTFAADANGSVSFTTKTVVKDSKLGADNLPTVTPNPGYQFDGWYKGDTKISSLADETITSAVTYTAKFTHATYSLTLSDGLTLKNKDGQSITTATHGTDLIFTPTVDGKVVIGITAKIGETAVPVTKNDDGSYTIAGDVITGDLTITAQTADGSWIFISKDNYKALSADAQIALLTTGKLASGNYLLGNDGMYWSPKYNAYVKIVDANETAATLTAKLSVHTDAEALTLAYTGDINGDGQATPADGGMINDELHEVNRSYTVTEKMRLEMDFSGDKTVSTVDIMNILRKYVGLD